jgi:hypothetical protein
VPHATTAGSEKLPKIVYADSADVIKTVAAEFAR